MPTIDLIHLDAGGQRAAAHALKGALRRQGQAWTVRPVALPQLLDPSGRLGRLAGRLPERLLLQAMLRAGQPRLAATLARHWAPDAAPDLVVSLVPGAERVLMQGLAQAAPGLPFVTAMTDPADAPTRWGVAPGTDRHLVCGTDQAVAMASAAGLPPDRIHRTRGAIVRPEPCRPDASARRAALRSLGLDPDRPTGLVMYGSYGSPRMLRIAERLDDLQLILMCGHNAALAGRLRGASRGAPHAVVGYTAAPRHYMGIADCFVGKPGPVVLAEALQCGLPVLTFRNDWGTARPPGDTDWIVREGVGRVVDSTRELPQAMHALLDGLDGYRQAVARAGNRAVLELPGILERVLRARAAPLEPVRQPVETAA
jgi:1,2-diacylglycerol 3-beta-galactosyltransferase